jgi:hypothetical protein
MTFYVDSSLSFFLSFVITLSLSLRNKKSLWKQCTLFSSLLLSDRMNATLLLVAVAITFIILLLLYVHWFIDDELSKSMSCLLFLRGDVSSNGRRMSCLHLLVSVRHSCDSHCVNAKYFEKQELASSFITHTQTHTHSSPTYTHYFVGCEEEWMFSSFSSSRHRWGNQSSVEW